MQTFTLQTDFVDEAAERGVIAAVARNPALYWELIDLLPAGVFACEPDAWERVARAIEAEEKPEAPEWEPAADPKEAATTLADLLQRRLLAQEQERLAAALYDMDKPAAETASLLEEAASRVQAAIRETQAGKLQWAADLLPDVLQEAEKRRQERERTGKACIGLPTGIERLDAYLGGMNEGLYILAGAPGMGKTTLALQIAATVTKEAPVIYVTFENSPENLTLKAIASRARVNPQDVQRGWADVSALRQAAEAWRPVANRLALIEGTSRLTLGQVRAKALQAMNRHKADKCLVIVDYLQLWAKASEELRGFQSVRERVEALGSQLRELATRLHSPVLALASQNRAQGDYGGGKGAANLDSLKESGDLEYTADAVLFLTQAKERQATPPARAVDLTLAKNRNGDIGKVELIFRPDIGDFREVARR